jgi:hypothetical protein
MPRQAPGRVWGIQGPILRWLNSPWLNREASASVVSFPSTKSMTRPANKEG